MEVSDRKAWLVRMIEAIGRITEQEDWRMLQREFFDKRKETLQARLMGECKNPEVSLPNVYRVQGQITEAGNNNLESLVETYKVELRGIEKNE